MINNKKAAFELSVTTIIVIVIGVTFLILGLVLVRTIFQGTTTSIGSIQQMTLSEIQKMFPESSESFAVSLPDGIAQIKPNTPDFGFAVKSSTKYGGEVGSREEGLAFILELDDKEGNCASKIGSAKVAKWFVDQEISTESNVVYNPMTKFEGSIAAERISLSIPSSVVPCDQKVFITFVDKTVTSAEDQTIGGSSFLIKIVKGSVFG